MTDVKTTRVFAGKLGDRVLTDLVLESGDRKLEVRILDNRHSRIQAPTSKWKVGEDVVILIGRDETRVSLTPDRIKSAGR